MKAEDIKTQGDARTWAVQFSADSGSRWQTQCNLNKEVKSKLDSSGKDIKDLQAVKNKALGFLILGAFVVSPLIGWLLNKI